MSKDLSCCQSLRRQFEKLQSKSSLAFGKLTNKLETHSDTKESELVEFEEWINEFVFDCLYD